MGGIYFPLLIATPTVLEIPWPSGPIFSDGCGGCCARERGKLLCWQSSAHAYPTNATHRIRVCNSNHESAWTLQAWYIASYSYKWLCKVYEKMTYSELVSYCISYKQHANISIYLLERKMKYVRKGSVWMSCSVYKSYRFLKRNKWDTWEIKCWKWFTGWLWTQPWYSMLSLFSNKAARCQQIMPLHLVGKSSTTKLEVCA